MEANLSFEKKSSRVPLTEGCCRLPSPCVRPSAGTAPFCCSSRQTWIFASPLYSVVQLLICSRPFQSKNSDEGGYGGGRERRGKGGRKENGGVERKWRWDKHASSFRIQRGGEQWTSSECTVMEFRRGGWLMWICHFPYVLLWRSRKEKIPSGSLFSFGVSVEHRLLSEHQPEKLEPRWWCRRVLWCLWKVNVTWKKSASGLPSWIVYILLKIFLPFLFVKGKN